MARKEIVRKEITRIETDPAIGLNDAQVKERAEAGYSNIVQEANQKTVPQIIFKNVFTFFNTILFTIAVVFLTFIIVLQANGRSDVVNEHFGFSKFLFLLPAIMNVITGTVQEIHSKKVLDNLKIVTALKSSVIRNGEAKEVRTDEVVVDDIMWVNAGEQAAADMIICEGEVSVDESMLTGEADHIKKSVGDVIYSGSAIVVGSAKARVDKVGNDTYAATLQKKVKSLSSHKSQLMTDIMKLVKILTIALGVVAIIIVSTLIYKILRHGGDVAIWGMEMSLGDEVTWARIMITVGSFAVGIIPSGLVLTTSVTLALSIVKLSRDNTLVQELYSLENLSRVDIICLDKTGTLTDGTMKLVDLKLYGKLEDVTLHIRNLLGAMDGKNQTAQAIYDKFDQNDKVEYKEYIPFSSQSKCSGLVYHNGDKVLMGAPEYLLDKADPRLEYVNQKASEGKRVIALLLNGELLCFFVIEDQIRASAPETLKFFRENGVGVRVISGDNPLTVSKIAKQCGVPNADKWISLEGMPLEKIPEIVKDYVIFARVSPEQKAALVDALQKLGHKVAMTGDGVNDILALRKADSSITFAKASNAAKSCSDVVLLDNDFSHLKEVVGQGRRVINNIQRSSVLFMMKSIAICLISLILIPTSKGQMWYTVENAYMLEAAVIGTGGFLLSLEPSKMPIKGRFIKNIGLKSIFSGLLAATAANIPVWFNIIPTRLGYEPLISATNVGTMMTILMTLAGFVVIFTMCFPFNKYRIICLIFVLLTAGALAFMLPTSYIGGRPTNATMFSYDSSIGQTIFDSVFLREFMRPWNSAVVKELYSDMSNIWVALYFIVIAIPTYILIVHLINRYLKRSYKKETEAQIAANINSKYWKDLNYKK